MSIFDKPLNILNEGLRLLNLHPFDIVETV